MIKDIFSSIEALEKVIGHGCTIMVRIDRNKREICLRVIFPEDSFSVEVHDLPVHDMNPIESAAIVAAIRYSINQRKEKFLFDCDADEIVH